MDDKRTVILHYGMSKTGSSSIQSSLYKALHGESEYIDLGAANANSQLIVAFSDFAQESSTIRKRGWSQEKINEKRREVRARLRQSIKRSTASKLIVSGECLSSWFEETDLRRLKNFLERLDMSAQAVGYVRRPKSFMESMFQQTLKGGAGRHLDACHQFYPQYQRRFDRFDTVFGAENVKCWLFSPEALYCNDVVTDFCERVGFAPKKQGATRKNDSLSLSAVSLLYFYRRYGEPFGVGPTAMRENQQLVARLSEIGGPKFKLHSALVQPVIEANSADIDWMERRHNCSLHENLCAEDEFAVRFEGDFLDAAVSALPWLEAQLQEQDISSAPTSEPSRYIAWLMGCLRKSLKGQVDSHA